MEGALEKLNQAIEKINQIAFAAGQQITQGVQAAAQAAAQAQAARAQKLNDILTDFQVVDDTIVEWRPDFGPLPIQIPFLSGTRMTATEAALLDQLGVRHGVWNGFREFKNIASNNPGDLGLAYTTADQFFPQFDAAGNYIPGGEDGHNDAFRHIYLNVLLTKAFGAEFAENFTTAHEGVPGNPADKEAMDLYNNSVGREIALANPDASEAELAQLVFDEIQNGGAVVINSSGDLVFSDQETVGQTGKADDPPATGQITPDAVDSN